MSDKSPQEPARPSQEAQQPDLSQWFDVAPEDRPDLSARQWSTERRLVDDSTSQGNLHYGSETDRSFERSGVAGAGEEQPANILENSGTTAASSAPTSVAGEGATQNGVPLEDQAQALLRTTDEPAVAPAPSVRQQTAGTTIGQGAVIPGAETTTATSPTYDHETTPRNQTSAAAKSEPSTTGSPRTSPVAPATGGDNGEQGATPHTTVLSSSDDAALAPTSDPAIDTTTGPGSSGEPVGAIPAPVVVAATPPDLEAASPTLNAASVVADEDTVIPLQVEAFLNDLDGSEGLSVTISGLPTGASLSSGSDNGDGSWTLAPEQLTGLTLIPPPNFNGEVQLHVTATATESASGDTAADTTSFSVMVNAVNDTAVITGTTTGSVSEDATTSASGTLAVTDVDTGEAAFSAATHTGSYGSLSIDESGNWNYALDGDNPDVQALGRSDATSDTITVTSADGTEQQITVNIAGTNDAPDVDSTSAPSFAGTEDRGIVVRAEDLLANASDVDGDTLSVTNLRVVDGGDIPVTIKLSGDHYDPDNIQDHGTGSPKFQVLVNGSQVTVDGASTFTVEESRGEWENFTFDVPAGTEIESVAVRFVNDAWEGTGDKDGDGIKAEDRNLVVDKINVGGHLADDGSFAGGVTVEAEKASYQRSSDTIAGQETMAWSGTLKFDLSATNQADYSPVVHNPDGTWTVYPDTNFNGELQLTYDVVDGQGGVTPATATIDVAAVNDIARIAGTSSGAVTEDGKTSVSGTLTVTDADTGEAHFIAATHDGTHGSLNISENGKWTYTLDNSGSDVQALGAGDTASDTITVTSADGSEQEIAIKITGTNDTPQASGAVSLPAGAEDTARVLTSADLLAHAADVDSNDTLAVANVSVDPAQGTITANPDGTFLFTPKADYNGQVSINYDVSDGTASIATSASLTLEAVNDAPVAVGETLTTGEDTAITIDVLANDRDADGDPLSIVAVADSTDAKGNTLGTTTIVTQDDGTQQIVFTPGEALDKLAAGESRDVEISYTVADGRGGTDTATATVTVQGVNNDLTYVSESAGYKNVIGIYQTDDAGNPVSGTILIDDQNGMAGGTHLADLEPGNYDFFLIADGADKVTTDSTITFDTSGSKPVLLIDGEPAAKPVYYTEPGFNSDGMDHFVFEPDGKGGTSIMMEDLPNLGDKDMNDVVLHVDFAMEDRTVVGPVTDTDTAANLVMENAAAGTEVGITARATDVDGDSVSYSLSDDADGRFAVDADSGVVTVAEGADLDYESATSHDITVQATSDDGSTSTRQYTVALGDQQENIAPVAVDDVSAAVAFDLPEGGTIVSTEGDTTVVKGEIVAEGTNGSSVDKWTFHHNGGPLTIDTLTESGRNFTDIDADGAKDHVDLMIRLYDDDGTQIAVNDDSNAGNADGSTNDYYAHVQDSYIKVNSLPEGDYTLAVGSWDISQQEVENDHNNNNDVGYNYNHEQDTGPYQITFTGDIDFTVDSPLTTGEDTPLTISADTLLANDTDADGDSLAISAVAHEVTDSEGHVVGSAELDQDGNVVVTPGDALDSLAEGESRQVSFNYTVSDGQGGSDTAAATVTVIGENDEVVVTEDEDTELLGGGNRRNAVLASLPDDLELLSGVNGIDPSALQMEALGLETDRTDEVVADSQPHRLTDAAQAGQEGSQDSAAMTQTDETPGAQVAADGDSGGPLGMSGIDDDSLPSTALSGLEAEDTSRSHTGAPSRGDGHDGEERRGATTRDADTRQGIAEQEHDEEHEREEHQDREEEDKEEQEREQEEKEEREDEARETRQHEEDRQEVGGASSEHNGGSTTGGTTESGSTAATTTAAGEGTGQDAGSGASGADEETPQLQGESLGVDAAADTKSGQDEKKEDNKDNKDNKDDKDDKDEKDDTKDKDAKDGDDKDLDKYTVSNGNGGSGSSNGNADKYVVSDGNGQGGNGGSGSAAEEVPAMDEKDDAGADAQATAAEDAGLGADDAAAPAEEPVEAATGSQDQPNAG
ncbi:MAG: hypothetical protein BWK76_09505 [Desulfobulbaceae bacterium A2]|nr:MAG: hypothetical protein BWK76_09505 [Desulfobulbaceae bacterium A2]